MAPEARRFGPYVVVRELGRGGFGCVYVARHSELGNEVALKVLLPDADSPELLARFELEAQAAARLRHPGIVAVHAYGVSDGSPYLAMDLVEGEPLDDRLARRGPLDPREAAELARHMAEAMEHAHQRSILHRDIKPANVIVGPDGLPRLTDFGLARDMLTERERLTQTGTLLGTPAYMSPEQAGGDVKTMGPAGDVYSLGATLYAMLTGHAPFERPSPIQVLTAIMRQDPPPPRSHRPDLDPALEAVVLRCLKKAPGARYASAQALADDLGRWLSGGAVEAEPPPGVGARLGRWASRSRGLLLAAGVALAALATLPLVATWRWERAAPSARDTKPPRLSLSEPESGATTEEETLRVSGRAFGEGRVDVEADAGHGASRVALQAGAFTLELKLGLGWNRVRVTARDANGREARAEVRVRRLPEWFARAARRPARLPDAVEATPLEGVYRNTRDGSLLVWIPGGSFTMGEAKGYWSKDEAPAHQVTLTRGFFLGQHELSREAYERFCSESERQPPERRMAEHEAGPGEPVVEVSWDDAQAYCAWAGLRLPTEAEWERAARSGVERRNRPLPSDFEIEGQCNMAGGDAFPYTSPAGAFREFATPWGCEDMAGNVREWVQDAYQRYSAEAVVDPCPTEGAKRVTRGGSWKDTEWTQRSAYRSQRAPSDRALDLGFRVALGVD